MPTLESALTSAGVAAFITLAIEWAAKPKLEARKERILERERGGREVRQLLADLVRMSGSFPSTEMWEKAPEEAQRRVEKIRTAARRLEDIQVDWAVDEDEDALHALMTLSAFVQGVLFSVDPDHPGGMAAVAIKDVGGPLLDWTSTRRWRRLRRRKLVGRAQQGIGWLTPDQRTA